MNFFWANSSKVEFWIFCNSLLFHKILLMNFTKILWLLLHAPQRSFLEQTSQFD